MMDILELAAKCRNSVVRNALIATAATGRGVGIAERLAARELRSAKRDENAARSAFWRMANEAGADGGEPKYFIPLTAELSELSDAENRAGQAKELRSALWAFHDRLED